MKVDFDPLSLLAKGNGWNSFPRKNFIVVELFSNSYACSRRSREVFRIDATLRPHPHVTFSGSGLSVPAGKGSKWTNISATSEFTGHHLALFLQCGLKAWQEMLVWEKAGGPTTPSTWWNEAWWHPKGKAPFASITQEERAEQRLRPELRAWGTHCPGLDLLKEAGSEDSNLGSAAGQLGF